MGLNVTSYQFSISDRKRVQMNFLGKPTLVCGWCNSHTMETLMDNQWRKSFLWMAACTDATVESLQNGVILGPLLPTWFNFDPSMDA